MIRVRRLLMTSHLLLHASTRQPANRLPSSKCFPLPLTTYSRVHAKRDLILILFAYLKLQVVYMCVFAVTYILETNNITNLPTNLALYNTKVIIIISACLQCKRVKRSMGNNYCEQNVQQVFEFQFSIKLIAL